MGLDECPLAERLGVGIGVRPAECLRPGGSSLDQLLSDPLVSELLGPDGDHVGASCAEFSASANRELGLSGVTPRL